VTLAGIEQNTIQGMGIKFWDRPETCAWPSMPVLTSAAG